MWIAKREYEQIISARNYWQSQYERERSRADQLANNLLRTNGLPPASGLEQADATPDHPTPMKTRIATLLNEMFNEETLEAIDIDQEN